MTHYLSRYLRNFAFVSSVVVPFVFSSCEKDNSPPVASLVVSPLSGVVPLDVRVRLSAVDPDGDGDVVQYKLSIGGRDTVSSSPFDFVKTFRVPGSVSIYGVVTDSRGHVDMTDSRSVVVSAADVPFIDQSVSLVDDINLKYSAILSNVSGADLIVTRGGVAVFSDRVAAASYAKLLTYPLIIKGDYDFLLKSNSLEKRIQISVPNYLPTLNLVGLNSNVTEYSQVNVVLPSPVDKNPEDVDCKIISVKSLDGKTKLALNGNVLTVQALPNFLGGYQAEVEYGSAAGGISKSILSGSILVDPRPKVNPFLQPNDSTLNWYGSGDVNLDNRVDASDRQLLMDIVNGVYSGSSDIRLLDRADVNGDGVVDVSDFNLLNNKLTGLVGYLPGYWNLLMTRGERVDWLGKMMAIDHTELLLADKTANCVQFSNQLMINFRGFGDADLSKFLSVFPYDVTTNGRFNIPVCEVLLSYNDYGTAHMMNTVVVGDDAFNWNDLCNIEPQFDAFNLQPGDYYLYGSNTTFSLRGPPITLGNGIINMENYCGYLIKNNIPSFYPWRNPDLLFVNSRSKK